MYELNDQAIERINNNKFNNRILNLCVKHTSASFIMKEKVDPVIKTDLINYFDKLVPMDSNLCVHNTEGKYDTCLYQVNF